jgi:serine/threonine protein phosphatase PrpC
LSIKTVSFAASDIGRVRASNQDSGYAGYNLFFVADGMGGHAGGDIASALTTQRVATVDKTYDTSDDAAKALIDVVWEANSLLGSTAQSHPELAGLGTTFSGIVFTGDKVSVGHIGDSRIYLARDGEVSQVTSDHTFVQRLVDTGRITAEEALVHPRRSVLMRVLGDVEEFPDVDSFTMQAKPGDRWLLCSDGLSGVVPPEIAERILLSKMDSQEACELLVGEALEFGAPDNVTVVVVDVLAAELQTDFSPSARFVGSAANEVVIEERKGRRTLKVLNPLNLIELIRRVDSPESYIPESDEYLEKILRETRRSIRWRKVRQLLTVLTLVALAIYGAKLAYDYTQTRYYVGVLNEQVTIYQGIKESLGPLMFSSPYEKTDLFINELNPYQIDLLNRTISAESLADAQRIVKLFESGGAE